jgi:hypothetical protein
MASSQNGYAVLDGDTSGPQPRCRLWQIPTVERKLKLRDGSAGFLLVHLAMWFDQTIERLDAKEQYDDWAWASRPIRGSSSISNHASGTAMDLNATKHPMGVKTTATFNSGEIHKIHRRLKFYNDCIRWGGDYQSRPDAMHFEIDRGLEAVERRAKSLTDAGRGKAICQANPGARAFIYS